jgi:hypothetical protein
VYDPLEHIAESVAKFLRWRADTNSQCYLTPVGCGLAGYLPNQVAPLFNGVRDSWVPRDWYPCYSSRHIAHVLLKHVGYMLVVLSVETQ